MRITIMLNDDLLEEARRLTGIQKNTAIVHEALKALIAREATKCLPSMGGSQPRLRSVPRRR